MTLKTKSCSIAIISQKYSIQCCQTSVFSHVLSINNNNPNPHQISQLLLTRFWPNFKLRFLGTTRTDFNCHGNICPGNICPGNICTYQQPSIFYFIYKFKSYWSLTLKTQVLFFFIVVILIQTMTVHNLNTTYSQCLTGGRKKINCANQKGYLEKSISIEILDKFRLKIELNKKMVLNLCF